MKDKWISKRIVELVEIKVSGVDKKIFSYEIPVRLCNYMDAYRNDYLRESIPYSEGSVSNAEKFRFSLIKDDVIITKDSETPEDIAVSSVVVENLQNVVCGYHLSILRPNQEIIDGQFLMHKLKLPSVQRLFYRIASGSTRYGLTIGGIENVTIKIPKLPQQKKIAQILSTCDAVLEKTEAAIAKYHALKQGLMHDLFTRGIDLASGHLRPTYNEAPELYKETELGFVPSEWEYVEIGLYSGITKLAGFEYTNYFDYSIGGEIVAIRALNLKKGKLDLTHIHTIPKATSEFLVRSQLKKGDVVISYVGTLGEIAVIPESRKFHLAPNVAKISVDRQVLNPFFLNEYLAGEAGQKEIFRWAASTTQAALSMENLRQVRVIIPSMKEQNSIYERLETINIKIDAEQQTFAKYKQLKAGLMQDLLSGKVGVEGLVNELEHQKY